LEFAEKNDFEASKKHIFADLDYSGETEKKPDLHKAFRTSELLEFSFSNFLKPFFKMILHNTYEGKCMKRSI